MLEDIKQKLDSEFDITVYDFNENVLTASCRNWGNWEFPDDMDCDDGEDEDCDYEELTSESYGKLKSIIAHLGQDYPEFEFDIVTGEKNYIDFRVARKL